MPAGWLLRSSCGLGTGLACVPTSSSGWQVDVGAGRHQLGWGHLTRELRLWQAPAGLPVGGSRAFLGGRRGPAADPGEGKPWLGQGPSALSCARAGRGWEGKVKGILSAQGLPRQFQQPPFVLWGPAPSLPVGTWSHRQLSRGAVSCVAVV